MFLWYTTLVAPSQTLLPNCLSLIYYHFTKFQEQATTMVIPVSLQSAQKRGRECLSRKSCQIPRFIWISFGTLLIVITIHGIVNTLPGWLHFKDKGKTWNRGLWKECSSSGDVCRELGEKVKDYFRGDISRGEFQFIIINANCNILCLH